MKKRFKPVKRVRFKNLFFPIFSLFILLLFAYVENNVKVSLSENKIISSLINNKNKYSYTEIDDLYFSKEIYNYIRNNLFNSPVNLLKNELNYDSGKTDTIETISLSYIEKKIPRIYIYNSHQGETYRAQYLEEYNIVPDVLMAANILKEKLDDLNIPTLVENSNILSYMNENNLNHNDSYIASRYFLNKIINKYPFMDLYIDLHRDAISHSLSTTEIDGKACAKIMFVIGLEHSSYEKNLEVVNKINNIILEKYPSLTRGILKKSGYGVNGIYNQDAKGNVILIELGGNENNIEEINNTLDIVSRVIWEYINEKK